MYRSHYSPSFWRSDVFAELDRLQQQWQQAFDISPSIRGWTRGSYPTMNVGTTPQSVEVVCFAPGIDPASIDVQIEKGVLSISGERRADHSPASTDQGQQPTVHIDERFIGKFRRVVTLPDDADAEAVNAQYRDGVLTISVQRRKAVQPRRIVVQ